MSVLEVASTAHVPQQGAYRRVASSVRASVCPWVHLSVPSFVRSSVHPSVRLLLGCSLLVRSSVGLSIRPSTFGYTTARFAGRST